MNSKKQKNKNTHTHTKKLTEVRKISQRNKMPNSLKKTRERISYGREEEVELVGKYIHFLITVPSF